MTFLTPLALISALLAIPILLLYMLRLRRREVTVSSHFLWQQVIRDQEANTPWQRLRRNWLMLLQLLILVLLVSALARPAQAVPTLSAGRSVVLLDASASMNATDEDGDQSRWQVALNHARTLIDDMGAGDSLSFIRVGTTAEILIGYSNSREALRSALVDLQASQGAGDWETAFTLALAGAQDADDFNVVVISDGTFADSLTRLPPSATEPVYIPVGKHGDNLGITAFAHRALSGDTSQLFAQVQNYGEQEAEFALIIRLDGELWQSRTQIVAGGGQLAFNWTIDRPFNVAQAELRPGAGVRDALALDDMAWAIADEQRTRRILLVSQTGNRFLEQALASFDGVQTFRGDASRSTLPNQTYDLVILEGYLPATLPEGALLIINPPRSTDLFQLGSREAGRVSWRITALEHPLMAFMTVDAVNLGAYRPVTGAEWAQTLITTETGEALLLAGEQAGRRIALLPFDLRDSDLPLQVAFPILIANLLEWYSPANTFDSTRPIHVGESFTVRAPVDADNLRLSLPDGSVRTLTIEGATTLISTTDTIGRYQLDMLNGDEVVQTVPFAVNLFNPGESAITPRSSLAIGGSVSANGHDESIGWREYWEVLALIALGLIMLEWWWHHRRLRPPQNTSVTLHRTTARR